MGPLIFSMALPAMISMIINALYNIVDSIFVAKYSQDALAAVSLVYPLQMLVVAIGVGTGVGVNSLIARRLGEKRQKHADSAVGCFPFDNETYLTLSDSRTSIIWHSEFDRVQ